MRFLSKLALTSFLFCCMLNATAAAPNIELEKEFSSHIATKYFKFHSNIALKKLQVYAEFSEQFVDLVDRDFFKISKKRFPLNAYVLPDKESFQKFLTEKFSVKKPPGFGIYLSEANAFVIYDGSGLGTFTHEIAHALVEESLKNRPAWAIEGIPTFFEKFFAYSKDNILYANWGYQNPWRIEDLGDRITKIKLIRVIYGSEDQSEKRLLSVFLFQQGKLRSYFDLIQAGNKKGYRTYVEAVFDKPLYQIDPIWEAYLKDIASNKEKHLRIPSSAIFKSEVEMRQFMKANTLPFNSAPL